MKSIMGGDGWRQAAKPLFRNSVCPGVFILFIY